MEGVISRAKHISDKEAGAIAVLSAQGLTSDEVAKSLGRSRDAVHRTLKRPDVVAARAQILASTTHTARAVLAAKAARAAERLGELVDSEREDTALRASGSVLDRVGLGGQTTVRHVRELPQDELDAEYLAALALLRERGEL